MKAITWDELADLYNAANGGRRAKTLPMKKVWDWAAKQKDRFFIDKEGYLYHKEEE